MNALQSVVRTQRVKPFKFTSQIMNQRLIGLYFIPVSLFLILSGTTLTVIVGLEHKWAIIISASVAVLYTILGGLYSVVFTDVLQLGCIIIGLVSGIATRS